MQGSAMMYVTSGLLYRRQQLIDQLWSALVQGRFDEYLVESRGVSRAQPGRVVVVREAHDRDVRPGVGDLVAIDAGHVGDHQVRLVDAVRRHEAMPRQEGFELPAEEDVDPAQQDRRHGLNVAR